MNKIICALFFTIYSTVALASSELRNTTMNYAFQIHGIIGKNSTETILYVTGNIVFPIANKYSSGARKRIIETLHWTVEVEDLPIEVSNIISCAIDTVPVTHSKTYKDCSGEQVQITIMEPEITFKNWGVPLGIRTDDLSIMPVRILKKYNNHVEKDNSRRGSE